MFILGLLAMLMPLSIDMYLPALPVIAAQYNVPDGSARMTLSTYILGLRWVSCCTARWRTALARKPVILGRTLVFAAAAEAACALSQTVDMLIVMRFFHGLAAAAAASVVINALMRDIYPKMSFRA
ncbi:MFS transporter [Klebsiella pneumoniae]|nr:MFS transporter [Klebsiella pneumoniae]